VNTSNSYIHIINRDEVERYVVAIFNGDLKVFDLEGNQKTVAFPNGKGYLTAANPRTSFKVMTIADYSFILNTTITVTEASDTFPGTLTGSRQLFSDLSGTAPEGQIWEVAGDPGNNFDNYYVKRTGGVYLECPKPGTKIKFTASTMPFSLVRLSDGTFSFKVSTWDDKSVGDENSSPMPSFVGNKISDLFLYRNRLGFVSNENVVLSKAGEYFNFWRDTAMDVLDSDPIDVAVSHSKVSNIHHAIPFNKNLMLFSEQTQFTLTGGDALTAKTVRIDQTTEFETTATVKPVGCGPNIYFITPRSGGTAVREYFVSDDTVTNDAAEITKHVPTYIPENVFRLSASPTEDKLFILSTDTPNEIYVYEFYWQGNEKKQASWSRWELDADSTVLCIEVLNSVAYMVVHRTSGVYLEKVDLNLSKLDTVGYRVLLDRKVTLTGSYNSFTNTTTWTLPYDEEGSLQAILGTAFGELSGSLLPLTRVNSATYTATGNYTAGSVFIGKKYTTLYRFSRMIFKDLQKDIARLGPIIRMRNLLIDYSDTGNFEVKVTQAGRTPTTTPFKGRRIGTGNLLLNKPVFDSDRVRVPIFSDPKEVTVEIINDTPMPCFFTSAEWEPFIQRRS
jgi:hypothetical protein